MKDSPRKVTKKYRLNFEPIADCTKIIHKVCAVDFFACYPQKQDRQVLLMFTPIQQYYRGYRLCLYYIGYIQVYENIYCMYFGSKSRSKPSWKSHKSATLELIFSTLFVEMLQVFAGGHTADYARLSCICIGRIAPPPLPLPSPSPSPSPYG